MITYSPGAVREKFPCRDKKHLLVNLPDTPSWLAADCTNELSDPRQVLLPAGQLLLRFSPLQMDVDLLLRACRQLLSRWHVDEKLFAAVKINPPVLTLGTFVREFLQV